jgi:hypothetical protein
MRSASAGVAETKSKHANRVSLVSPLTFELMVFIDCPFFKTTGETVANFVPTKELKNLFPFLSFLRLATCSLIKQLYMVRRGYNRTSLGGSSLHVYRNRNVGFSGRYRSLDGWHLQPTSSNQAERQRELVGD